MKKLSCAILLFALALVGLSLPAAPPADPAKENKPINLPFNTAADEDDPHVASNGLVLYYSCNASKGKWDVMVSTRLTTMRSWSPGKILEDYVQTKVDDRAGCVTTEGIYPQFLFYATKKDNLKDANFDIYVAVKQDRGRAFSSPTPVNETATADDELHPWLTADARQLYFSRKVKDGWRVLVCSRPGTFGARGFGDPVLLEELPPNFHHATLTRDGKTMYLQGPVDDKGRWGLFVTQKTAKGWGKPQALDMLNSSEGKIGTCSPCLNREGTLLYFASDRPEGKGGLDIWVVPTDKLGKK